MHKFDGRTIGVETGDIVLFSDFEDGGEMWTGDGPRESRTPVAFSESFTSAPSVTVGLSMWDMSNSTNIRADIRAEGVTITGFDLVFRTWGDSKVARMRANWQAIGPVQSDEVWDI